METKDLDQEIEEAFMNWRSTWDLEDMTLREIYEAGFRHGREAGRGEADEG